MGTRVDFYVGRGSEAEWLGSYPFDGYPSGVFGDDKQILAAPTEEAWRAWVADFLAGQEERATLPEHGWPWPWGNSQTTDYAYAWDGGAIYGSSFGHPWFAVDPTTDDYGDRDDDDETWDGRKVEFPDMTARSAFTLGPRSGVIVVGF